VIPALSPGVDTIAHLAQEQAAIAAINGGFFDPTNQKTTARIILQGKLVADPTQNQQLMGNLTLLPYLQQILNRSEFRRYQCGTAFHYAIVRRQTAVPTGCHLLEALGGGPQLLPEMTATAEGFWDATTGRDPIGIARPNARTAVGLRSNGDMLWVMAAQIPGVAQAGLSLAELTTFLRSQGAITALNFDGGSSATFYYQGKTISGKLDQQGQAIDRPVKSVLLLLP
jgi:Phosphodiester glycosidase